MKTYVTAKHQTIQKLAAQLYGNIDAVSELLALNDFTNKMDNGGNTTDEVDISLNVQEGVSVTYDENSPLRNERVLKELKGRVLVVKQPLVLLDETLAYAAEREAQGSPLTEADLLSYNTFFGQMIEYSLLERNDIIYSFDGGTEASATINLVDPRDLDAAFRLTLYNSPTIDSKGIQWNATTQYGDTHYIPATHGTAEAHLSYYILGSTNVANREVGATKSGTALMLAIRQHLTTAFTNVISGNANFTKPAGGHYFIVSRQGSDVMAMLDGNNLGTLNPTLGTLSNLDIPVFVGALNNSGTPQLFSATKGGFVTIGTGMSLAQMTLQTTIVNELMTALEKNEF